MDVLLTSMIVFDRSRIKSGDKIEISGECTFNDLIRYEAIVTDVFYNTIKYAYIDPETKRLKQGHLRSYNLSTETYDGWSIRIIDES